MRRKTEGLGMVLVAILPILAGCFEERERPTVPVFGDLAVSSDPEGAEIFVDGRSVGLVTPATVEAVEAGERRLDLVLGDGTAEEYSFSDSIVVPEEDLLSVQAPLQGGCLVDCPFLISRGRVDCRFTGAGDTCASVFFRGVGLPGLEWPAGSGADYGAGGRLLTVGIVGDDGGSLAGDTLGIPLFELGAWIGRRPLGRVSSGRRQEVNVEYWARSSFAGQYLQGLLVRERLVSVDSAGVENAVLLSFELVNNSGDELYRKLFPWIPEGGFTIRDLYMGFGLDADAGGSDDDLGTFDPALNLGFIYDADFRDPALPSGFRDRPALVGVATIEAPASVAGRTLTFWNRDTDWDAARDFGFAWRLLSGNLDPGDPLPDHPADAIGHHPGEPADYRFIDAYGPLTLAPGESTRLTVGLILAEPAVGTFTPGTRIDPGDPAATDRPILDVAAQLRSLAGQLPELWTRYGN